MNYSSQVLNIFFNALIGNEKAKMWLYENEYEELTAFVNGLFGLPNAETWLLSNSRFQYLGQLSKAIKRDSNALTWLIDHGYDDEAATTGMIHENLVCEQWLLSNDRLVHLKIGEILRNKF